MFDFSAPVFDTPRIPQDADVIFVADAFAEQLTGGAELTSQALIHSSPFKVHTVRSRDLTVELLQEGVDRFWIFGNFAQMDPQLIPAVLANVKYSVVEYDYKYCQFRSPEKHMAASGMPCDCHNRPSGRLVAAFFYGAMNTWWMSEAQRSRYTTLFPFLSDRPAHVLSSVFDAATLRTIATLRASSAGAPRRGWAVLHSDSWIKGTDAALKWCADSGKEVVKLGGQAYGDVLRRLSEVEGLAYLPPGGDTCPRMVIEAKLLGCQLHVNDNVQHRHEPWFATDDLAAVEAHLAASPARFWAGIGEAMRARPSISGYTTTLNCIAGAYPFEQSISSMLQFCTEVCVVDGGSSDGTLERLAALKYRAALSGCDDVTTHHVIAAVIAAGFPDRCEALSASWSGDPSVKVKVVPRDWGDPRSALFDGEQKALARAMCISEFCWQMDSDEVVHEDDVRGIEAMCRAMPPHVEIVSLPVIEYWGPRGKVRMDIQPWKWRLSRNRPHITHGVPRSLRRFDAEGRPCASPGTDGCDMIHATTHEPLPHTTFYSADVENARVVAILGNEEARAQYEAWFNNAIASLPSVHHYSWYDIGRKIRLYRSYWARHWRSLYGEALNDTADDNVMFDVPWSQVTDDMIAVRAAELEARTGGWVWHRKWDGSETPSISVARSHPRVMEIV